MPRSLNTYDNIAIAEIVIYIFFLLGAIFLCTKHGFGKNAGWFFLMILSIARLLGSSLLLATINDPTNESLYVGSLVLNGLGFGPLILMLLGLLSRVFDSVNHQGHVVVKPIYQRITKLIVLVALILIIIGGTDSEYSMTTNGTPKVEYDVKSKAGVAVFILVTVLLVAQTYIAVRHRGYISQGEHRLLFAIVSSIPFVIVRLAYTADLILGSKPRNVWMYLGAGVIMEMMVVLICEGVGFTLGKVPVQSKEEAIQLEESSQSSQK